MPIEQIAKVLTAAKMLYDQVDKAKHNGKRMKWLVHDMKQMMIQVDAASQITPDKLESNLNGALKWINDADKLVKKLKEQGLVPAIKRFVNAGNYRRELDDLIKRLGTIQDNFNSLLSLDIKLNQEKHEEAMQIATQTMVEGFTEIKFMLSQANADREEFSDELIGALEYFKSLNISEILQDSVVEIINEVKQTTEAQRQHVTQEHEKTRACIQTQQPRPGLFVEQWVGGNVDAKREIKQDVMPLDNVPATEQGISAVMRDRGETRSLIRDQGGLTVRQEIGAKSSLSESTIQRVFATSFSRSNDDASSVASTSQTEAQASDNNSDNSMAVSPRGCPRPGSSST